MKNKSVVLVTGASSGLGREIAKTLAQKGHIVYGTSRIMEKSGQIDVLINNAGRTISSPVEEMPSDTANELMHQNKTKG